MIEVCESKENRQCCTDSRRRGPDEKTPTVKEATKGKKAIVSHGSIALLKSIRFRYRGKRRARVGNNVEKGERGADKKSRTDKE